MAEILRGDSDHKVYAPLTSGQTIQLGKHLEGQIKQIQAGLEGLRQSLVQTNAAVQGVTNKANTLDATAQTLQGDLSGLNQTVNTCRKAIGRSEGRLVALEAGAEKAGKALGEFSDAQMQANVRAEAVRRDTVEMKARLRELEAGLERNFSQDDSRMDETMAATNRLAIEIAGVKTGLNEQKTMIQDSEKVSRGLRMDLDRAGAHMSNLEERYTASAKTVSHMENVLSDTQAHVSRNREELHKTKARVQENQDTLRQLSMQVDKMEQGSKRMASVVQSCQIELGHAKGQISSQGAKVEAHDREVQRLLDTQSAFGEHLRSVQVRAEEASQVAMAVKVGLKETNAIVLPNIQLDTSAAMMLGRNTAAELEDSERGIAGWSPSGHDFGGGMGGGGKAVSPLRPFSSPPRRASSGRPPCHGGGGGRNGTPRTARGLPGHRSNLSLKEQLPAAVAAVAYQS
eukprot:TRINITY_DN25064_c0_g1_i1.p1 TRINITY_DN25064_c0_g1~~TRINITY_DN25064_c0_g1_i1.p1  ORF type:complete len:488 (+),score=77.23 TRINITY_DN25064_c0_g1_i1:96-1466(+)